MILNHKVLIFCLIHDSYMQFECVCTTNSNIVAVWGHLIHFYQFDGITLGVEKLIIQVKECVWSWSADVKNVGSFLSYCLCPATLCRVSYRFGRFDFLLTDMRSGSVSVTGGVQISITLIFLFIGSSFWFEI